jgi:hypothetical protein
MKLSEAKTARQRNEEFAKVTKKTVFMTNIYENLPDDDTPLADDEEEEPLLQIPQKRRKPAKTKNTAKTKKPPKPKPRPTVEDEPALTSSATPNSAPKRNRNETKKVDDQLNRKHNVATISIGPSKE